MRGPMSALRFRRKGARLFLAGLVVAAVAAPLAHGSTRVQTTTHARAKASARGAVLRIANDSPPASLNPADGSPSITDLYISLSYASLINLTNGNKYTPGLATSWHYVGNHHKTFVLKLRPNVKFSNGQPVTAKAVANSINFFKHGTAATVGDYSAITAKATGPLKVTLTSKVSDPFMAQLMTPGYLGGAIIAPAGLANPKKLASHPLGAGEYVLDPSATIVNSRYTFLRNPRYYDQKAIHYNKIVVSVITTDQEALSAIEAGQLDVYVGGSTATASSAKAAGIQVLHGQNYWEGLLIIDPRGRHFPELANVNVRRAISYAINRKAIAHTIYGPYGSPEDQPALTSFLGYTKTLEKDFPYNPTKAKQLLTQAGYGSGFTLPVIYLGFPPFATVMQAIGSDLSAVGIKLSYSPQTSLGGFFQTLNSGKVAAFDIPISVTEAYFAYQELWGPTGTFNPNHETNSKIKQLFNRAVTASGKKAKEDWSAMLSYVTKQAWTIPVLRADQLYYANKNTKVGVDQANGVMDYTAIKPAG